MREVGSLTTFSKVSFSGTLNVEDFHPMRLDIVMWH